MAAQKRPKIRSQFRAVTGSACKTRFESGLGAMHGIDFVFVTDDGEEVTVSLDYNAARDVLNSGIAAYEAIMKPLQIARNVPFGI